jgi:hypothetical protein
LISIGELNARPFKGAANSQIVCGRHAGLTVNKLGAPDGAQAHGR